MHVIFDWNYIKASRNNFRRLVLIVATSRLTIKFDYEEFLFQVSIEQGVDGSTRFKGWDGLNFVFTGFSSSSVLRCFFFFFCGIETETKTPNDWLTTRALPGFTGFSASRRASATCSALFNWRRCQTWLGLFRVVEFVPWRWPRTDTRKPSAWPGFSLSMSFFFLFTLPSSFGSRPLFLCFFVGGNEET